MNVTYQITGGVMVNEELIINDELVTVTPVKRTKLTKRRLALTYKPWGPALAPFQRVYAVGADPECALGALGKKIGWGKLDHFRFESASFGSWYCRFTADGTSMKAGGRYVPGGVIVDWWK